MKAWQLLSAALGFITLVCTGCAGSASTSPDSKRSGRRMLVNPCRNSSSKFPGMPFCNASLSLEDRISDAISRMTVAEKISAMGSSTPAIASLGLPPYNWWNEATSGVQVGDHESTKFPYPITSAMSFNRSLWSSIGRQIGLEARALMNVGHEFSTYWLPVINLAREPRWGRNIETPGEDPYLTGEFAANLVRAFQEAPEDPGHMLASACCKHYVANSMEITTQLDGEHDDRHHADEAITMQDLVDSYMRPFQACVEKGRVSSLMCSYNAVNGVPSCANDWLLDTVARKAWGFDGYITGDCNAVDDVYHAHHYAATHEEAVRDVLKAGTDIDCGTFLQQHTQSALDKKFITVDDVDARLRMQFRVRMRLGHFDPPNPLDAIPESIVCSDASKSLSYEAVEQSVVLLKNMNATLPLDEKSVGLVGLSGPTVNISNSDYHYYGPAKVCDQKVWTLLDAVSQGGQVRTNYTPGVPTVLSEDTRGIPAAVALAAQADTVILSVGTGLDWAREAHDATNISFTDAQVQLLEQVAAAAKKPIIVVVMTATPLDLSAVLANPKVGAVLHVGQPSVAVLGLTKILFGGRSPAGRMIQTVYESSYQDQISIFDFNMRPGPSKFARPDCRNHNVTQCPRGTNPGRTYRFYTGKAVVPFGFGLSYTTFEYSLVRSPTKVSLLPLQALIDKSVDSNAPFLDLQSSQNEAWLREVQLIVNVTNTGAMDADDVVLGFLVPPDAGKHGMPLKQLFGFERVHVKAGQTVTVYLYPTMHDFVNTDEDGKLMLWPGDYRIEIGVADTHSVGMGFLQVESPLRAVSSHERVFFS